MTSPDVDRLYPLLPAFDRLRDTELGEPLRALLAVIAEQVNNVQSDLDNLYSDWFIETCQNWTVPYIGDLVGYQVPAIGSDVLAANTPEAARLLAALAPRRDVANTIPNRRRKGTLALLERLAQDVANWPARAVEFYRPLHETQPVRLYGTDRRTNRQRLERGRFADLRHADALDRIDGPFDRVAHLVDVRQIDSHRSAGRYDVPEVGVFVWRLRAFSITNAPAHGIDESRGRYTFSVLGNDTHLVNLPVAEPSPSHIADESNVPAPIRRRAFEERPADFYGPGKSFVIYVGEKREIVPLRRIVAADLSRWAYRPRPNQVAVDPVLGRIAFPARYAPDDGVWVSYHYGFADELGGGEYRRVLDKPVNPPYQIGPGHFPNLMAAVRKWREDKEDNPALADAVIEFIDSGAYSEREPVIRLDPGDKLEIRAAQGERPVLRLFDWETNRPDALRIEGVRGEGKPGRIILDGLLVTGRGVRVSGPVEELVVRHCTLVPGWSIDHECRPRYGAEASLELDGTPRKVCIQRSILGSILIDSDEIDTEPMRMCVTDSIIDATDDELPALSASDCRHAYVTLDMARCTVIGSVHAHAVSLLENSILLGRVNIARRQSGCVRFCWLPPVSRTPRRFHCQPETSGDPARVTPRFDSLRYGTPDYARLRLDTATEIFTGADDESEMGVYHDLYQPQRISSLRDRLTDYTPAGARVGILFAS